MHGPAGEYPSNVRPDAAVARRNGDRPLWSDSGDAWMGGDPGNRAAFMARVPQVVRMYRQIYGF